MTARNIATLILAAGASSRMGQPKVLLPWGKTTILGHLLGQLQEAGLSEIVLVTGAHHHEIKAELTKSAVRFCYHKGWKAGMGSSLGKGVNCISEAFTDIAAILVLLSDQPLISSAYLKEMLLTYQNNPEFIVATAYEKGEGVPALFPRRFWPDLQRIPPEKGAKVLIRAHREQTVLLDAGEANLDMDTPQAYRKILKKAGLDRM